MVCRISLAKIRPHNFIEEAPDQPPPLVTTLQDTGCASDPVLSVSGPSPTVTDGKVACLRERWYLPVPPIDQVGTEESGLPEAPAVADPECPASPETVPTREDANIDAGLSLEAQPPFGPVVCPVCRAEFSSAGANCQLRRHLARRHGGTSFLTQVDPFLATKNGDTLREPASYHPQSLLELWSRIAYRSSACGGRECYSAPETHLPNSLVPVNMK